MQKYKVSYIVICVCVCVCGEVLSLVFKPFVVVVDDEFYSLPRVCRIFVIL